MSFYTRKRKVPSACFERSSATPQFELADTKRRRLTQKSNSQTRRGPIYDRVGSSITDNVLSGLAPVPITVHGNMNDQADMDESLDHVVMAVDKVGKGVVGCAYYVAREERLFCMEDVADSTEDIVEILTREMQPTILLVPTRFEPHKKNRFGAPDSEEPLDSNREDEIMLPYKLERRPNSDFRYENALRKLNGLQSSTFDIDVRYLVPGDNSEVDRLPILDELGFTNQEGDMMNTAALLNLDSNVSIGCAGAIISCLQRKRASERLQDDPNSPSLYAIGRVEMFSLKDSMLVLKGLTVWTLADICRLTSAETIASLQIMQPESHPNSANQGPGAYGAKESFSLFGLFHHLARSPQGKVRLRGLFLRPSTDTKTITSRLDFISCFTRSTNESVLQSLSKSLSKIKNMHQVVTTLARGIEGSHRNVSKIKSGVWSSLLEFCYHTIEISENLHEAIGSNELTLCNRARKLLDRNLFQRLGKMIHDVVDLEKTMEERRTVVKRNVNPELDRIKDVYENIEEVLSETANEIANQLPAGVLKPNVSVIYMPQLGFLISIPCSTANGEPEWDVGDPGWELIFHASGRALFKNDQMRLMDEKLGDLFVDICDIEVEIAYELVQRVLQHRETLIAASDICGELDSLLALAHGAVQHKLSRPKIVEENVIVIEGGRHLLQEMVVDAFVANDTLLVGGQEKEAKPLPAELDSEGEDLSGPNMILLTGPNYSGKSVYQKQVALIAYLAQVGSFVPAESALIGISDKILTRIVSRETVSKGHSAFMIDLQQVSRALNAMTSRSLLIVDEFGKGTDSCDGAGLMAGVLEHLLALGDNSPKVLASTHFHEIFEHGRFDDYPNLALAHMEVLIDDKRQKNTQDPADVSYLYSLKSGRSNLSYGIQCAALNGIPWPVTERAQQLSDLATEGEDLTMICSALSMAEAEELERAESVARAFLRLDLEDYQDSDIPGGMSVSTILETCLEAASHQEVT